MPGTGLSTLHTVGTLIRIYFRDTVGVNENGIELAGLDAGAAAQTAMGAVQGAVAGDLHGGYTVLQADVAVKFVAGVVAAGTADKGDPVLLHLDLYTHDGGYAAGLQAGAAGTGVYWGLLR